ncbi:hypothetical protein SAY87_023782 [Trapa incisa]|uniref:Uncharacterized protein n=1 Tax=Trapa incisa TaxID=236973 RepID=A0AAN7L6Y9_9MYRT|nr:hypothetical protein SAY87_023782 [Trapa incisa]
MAALTEEMKTNAEVYHGHDLCQQKLILLLAEMGLPNVFVSSPEIEEFCYVKPLGLVWLRLGKRAQHKVVDNVVISYDTHVSACVGPNRIWKLTGVRAKEYLLWFNLIEIEMGARAAPTKPPARAEDSGLITFKTSVGVSRSFPVSIFQ